MLNWSYINKTTSTNRFDVKLSAKSNDTSQAGLSCFLIVNLGVPWTHSYQISQCSCGIVLKYVHSRNLYITLGSWLADSDRLFWREISQILICLFLEAVGVKKIDWPFFLQYLAFFVGSECAHTCHQTGVLAFLISSWKYLVYFLKFYLGTL